MPALRSIRRLETEVVGNSEPKYFWSRGYPSNKYPSLISCSRGIGITEVVRVRGIGARQLTWKLFLGKGFVLMFV